MVEKIVVSAKEIDLDLFVFVERYATNLLKWDLLTFFGAYPDDEKTAEEIAGLLGRNYRAVRSELGDLVILGVLRQGGNNGNPAYQLTNDHILRGQVIKFARNSH
jgi:hypothetical protein